jgi:hypothetical protein
VIRFSVRNVDGAEAGAPLFAAPAATPVGNHTTIQSPSRTGESDSPSKRRKLIATPFFVVAAPLMFFGTTFLSIAVWISVDDSYWEQPERP